VKRPQPSSLASALRAFLTDYLPRQRALSPHTLHSYRDSLKLLLQFVAGPKADPSHLTLEHLTYEQVMAFLLHLETRRHNQVSTRNVRLSAIRSFFRFVGTHYPEHLELAQRILSAPLKRTALREIHHLELSEIQALLRGIDRSTPDGRRDHVLLGFLFNTGARVSEAVGLEACDLILDAAASVRLRGKGRKERTCPLWAETAQALRAYLGERQVALHEPRCVFVNHRGQPLTRFGVRWILRKHVRQAARQVPALKNKRLHPHSVRHSTAIHLLRSGVDLSTIANWLGHVSINTTNKYLTLDLETKRQALDKSEPVLAGDQRGLFRCPDHDLIKWLESL
jgi:site-specific recombinase XerD